MQIVKSAVTFAVSIGLLHTTGLFHWGISQKLCVLINLQLANENGVSSLLGTGKELPLGLQSCWDAPPEIAPTILYVPRHRGCSSCGTGARGETSSRGEGRQVLADTRPARSAGHIAAVFPGCMGDAQGLGDVVAGDVASPMGMGSVFPPGHTCPGNAA